MVLALRTNKCPRTFKLVTVTRNKYLRKSHYRIFHWWLTGSRDWFAALGNTNTKQLGNNARPILCIHNISYLIYSIANNGHKFHQRWNRAQFAIPKTTENAMQHPPSHTYNANTASSFKQYPSTIVNTIPIGFVRDRGMKETRGRYLFVSSLNHWLIDRQLNILLLLSQY